MKGKPFYIFLNQKLQNQYREQSWGFRVAISVVIPLVWGFITDHKEAGVWMAIAAESVALIDLKGNIEQRIRILLSAAVLAVVFCFIGSVAGSYLVVSVLGMLIVGFLAALFKNLGDRGMGLALSIYIFYIITSAYPLQEWDALIERCQYVAVGAGSAVFMGFLSFLFLKIGTPYRRMIANIWNAIAQLSKESGKGWDGTDKKSFVRDIYLKEKEIRSAIDASLSLFELTSDQTKSKDHPHYNLTQTRKCASLVGSYIVQITENAEEMAPFQLDRQLSIQIAGLFRVLEQLGERMEVYLFSLNNEEKILVNSRLERLNKILSLLEEKSVQESKELKAHLDKIIILGNRVIKLVNHSISFLENGNEERVIRAYSFTQTFSILHPKYLRNTIRLLFNFNYLTTRYSLRIGISTMVAALIAYVFFKDHGYWIPFTTIIVAQPYIGATIKKALQRSGGTIAGIIIGFGFLSLPFPDASRIFLVFFSAIFMVYFLRRNYSIAAFFITLFLVGLLGVDLENDMRLLSMRVIATLIGSALAIAAGFVLLPIRDQKIFSKYLAQAFMSNIEYFQNTFYYGRDVPWVKWKRSAETMNANAFDSLTRLKQEPIARSKVNYESLFHFITHNVRITRELNNFNSEMEMEEERLFISDKEKYFQILYECDDLFRENLELMGKFYPGVDMKYSKIFPEEGFNVYNPTTAQLVYVEKLLLELKFIKAALENPGFSFPF